MRVSKTVREYIEKQVASKFPKTEIELYQEQQEQIASKMNQEYYDRVEKAKADIIVELAQEYKIHEEEIAIRNNYGNVFSTFNTPTAMKANTAKSERQKAVNAKITDIIVALELGGTKADLEKMLAEI
jgi:hypothetical protein